MAASGKTADWPRAYTRKVMKQAIREMFEGEASHRGGRLSLPERGDQAGPTATDA